MSGLVFFQRDVAAAARAMLAFVNHPEVNLGLVESKPMPHPHAAYWAWVNAHSGDLGIPRTECVEDVCHACGRRK